MCLFCPLRIENMQKFLSEEDPDGLAGTVMVAPAPPERIRGVFDHVRDPQGEPFSFERLEKLHRALAPSDFAFDKLWTHCQIVARIAVGLGEHLRQARQSAPGPAVPVPRPWNGALPDLQLVAVGALVHDIGVYRIFLPDGRTFDRHRYIFHGLEGYLCLLEERCGLEIAEFARNHTGVGITRSEVVAQRLPLPPDDYLPRTIEQELVMFADKFHTKSDPPDFVSLPVAYRSAARFGQSNAERFRLLAARYGAPELEGLAGEYGMAIRK
jgi:uncharacterized protein